MAKALQSSKNEDLSRFKVLNEGQLRYRLQQYKMESDMMYVGRSLS